MRVGRPVLVAMLVLVTSSTSALYVPQAHELVAEEEGTQDAIIAGGVDGGEPRDDGGERRASAGDGARAMVVDDDEAADKAEPPAPLPRMLLYTALLGGDKAFRSPLLPAFLWSAAKTPDVDILLIGDGEMCARPTPARENEGSAQLSPRPTPTSRDSSQRASPPPPCPPSHHLPPPHSARQLAVCCSPAAGRRAWARFPRM